MGLVNDLIQTLQKHIQFPEELEQQRKSLKEYLDKYDSNLSKKEREIKEESSLTLWCILCLFDVFEK